MSFPLSDSFLQPDYTIRRGSSGSHSKSRSRKPRSGRLTGPAWIDGEKRSVFTSIRVPAAMKDRIDDSRARGESIATRTIRLLETGLRSGIMPDRNLSARDASISLKITNTLDRALRSEAAFTYGATFADRAIRLIEAGFAAEAALTQAA